MIKLLTLKDIAPKWAHRLRKKAEPRIIAENKELIYDYQTCIVTEAHGGKHPYKTPNGKICAECTEAAGLLSYYYRKRDHEEFEITLKRWILHWNARHAGKEYRKAVADWMIKHFKLEDVLNVQRYVDPIIEQFYQRRPLN
ncbi:hypothetical protein Ngar_c03460 [Candidatus Nitrososphaera gargensis Ga9.2]|uniref:Uncharacterized protein n=1 Tax=Nitrososphaera gargensis (strain Ga9.2) TaxID=1237085 RepID=K0ILR4_NITGG|nr:hypothetical protein [Candidatus Nitrososphaera gargensis]AFU57264.1 hypothetical protein Ngar_c03160 [Candidatus Nitrososphaera gargensis Ga9.2]AFU57294.1 hypothetical protein Ngar_c03460 [Candidatus Nitrososphaera gargensis Ga9.2]